ncbi:MAG TPA: hypothetical protein VJ302_37150, partial [Blastocatellia bacterium]|nr:hypothetical protein [Blastocatellia bacterium]
VLVGASMVPPAFAQSRSGFEYNGIVHVSWWFNEYNNFDQPTGAATDSRNALAATGANWAAVLVTQYVANGSANVIAPEPSGQKTPTDASLIVAIQDLRGKGMRVMLKPHVDSIDGTWRGQFTPSNVDAWFQSYTTFIVHYAQLAQQQGVQAFCMGTEFVTLSGAANRARWLNVISAVRAVYSGTLTYAANATYPADEFTTVSFWDALDVMGLDAYFTLTNQNNPTAAALVSAWTSNANGENIVATLQNFSNSRGKPVIFTELGYKSVDGANTRPWDFGLSGAQDLNEQRDCYEAAFTVWSAQSSWMRGIFWWAWPVPAPASGDIDYNPRGKPADTVLRSWQGTATPTPNFALSMNPTSLAMNRGASGTSTISITRSGGFTGSVALSASGLPAGVTASFNPATATGASSVLTLTASGTATTGPATVTITGVGGGLTRTATMSLTVNAPATPNFALSLSAANLTVSRGGSGTSTVNIARSGGFTGSVAFTVSGLPAGVTGSFNPTPATGASSILTLTASNTATLGAASVTITGVGGGLTRAATLNLTVTASPSSGGVTITPAVTTSSPWFNEEVIRISNTAAITSLSITITLQRAGGINYGGQYNTVGGQILQSNSSTAAAITYQFSLASGQTLSPSTSWLFAAQSSGTGTVHPTAGDTYVVTYTMGGNTFSQTGHF